MSAAEDLRAAMVAARDGAGRAPVVVTMADVTPRAAAWLWCGRIPLGALTMLDGDPKVGKSAITRDLAARISAGRALPGEDATRQAADVLLLTAEDDPERVIRPALEAAMADLTRVHLLVGARDGDAGATEAVTMTNHALRVAVDMYRPVLVVIDPVQAYLGPDVDAHRAEQVRPVLAALAGLAREAECAILILRHLRKSSSDHAIQRGWGSIDFAAAARAVLLAGRDPADPERRALACIAQSWGAEAPAIGYTIGEATLPCGIPTARLTWTGDTDLTAAAMMAAEPAEPGEEHGALTDAEVWLRAALAAGPVPSRDLLRDAARDGIAGRTLRRARQAVGGVAGRVSTHGRDGFWAWRLPAAEGRQDAPAPMAQSLATLAEDPPGHEPQGVRQDGQPAPLAILAETMSPNGLSAAAKVAKPVRHGEVAQDGRHGAGREVGLL